MKFMVTWRVHETQRHETFKAFSQMTAEEDQADLGDGIKLIGRWHDLAGFTGVAICESDDPAAMASWVLNWNSVLDIETKIVFDDDEARAIGKAKLG